MSQRQRSEGPIDSTGPALYPAGHVLESRNKKREPPATFPFLFAKKQKCTRNLICGWKHLATRKKKLAVFSGHGLFRTNTYGASSTHPGPRTWALTGMNLSHKTAPTNLDRKHFFGHSRQIVMLVTLAVVRSTRPHCMRFFGTKPNLK